MERVITFIDNSNVYKRLADFRRADPNWIKRYNPLELSLRLSGASRELEKVMFYCTNPPVFLQRSNPDAYEAQMKYYEEVQIR